jgi:hypothetical protein
MRFGVWHEGGNKKDAEQNGSAPLEMGCRAITMF